MPESKDKMCTSVGKPLTQPVKAKVYKRVWLMMLIKLLSTTLV